jgi:hypothetical protein
MPICACVWRGRLVLDRDKEVHRELSGRGDLEGDRPLGLRGFKRLKGNVDKHAVT